LALIGEVGRFHPDLIFPVNDFLMAIPNLKPCFVPVNKHGSNLSYAKNLTEAFSSSRTVVHFPAGLCSRRKGHRIRDVQWQKSFIVQARRTGRPIVPTHISGANSRRFYWLAWVRKLSGLRFNYEMLLLVDEMYRQRGKNLHIRFGDPIDPAVLDPQVESARWAAAIRSYVYALGRGIHLSFAEAVQRGVIVP
jgi:1-acyl-sn-glycerol-3-phosphate acyltransferase